uniref:Uncharacterized protein n=1 Tax=Oryza barthii TaxID=65489 RepID=A0A0D3GZM1_9ORYZ
MDYVVFIFGIRQPRNTTHMFGNLLHGVEPRLKRQIQLIVQDFGLCFLKKMRERKFKPNAVFWRRE